MEYRGKRKVTKTVIEAARLRREEMFKGMTPDEIRHSIPVVKAYFYKLSKRNLGVFIPECVLCGETHLHGADEYNGHRSTHCSIQNEVIIPHNYQLQIDWEDEDNIRLAKEYNIPIKR